MERSLMQPNRFLVIRLQTVMKYGGAITTKRKSAPSLLIISSFFSKIQINCEYFFCLGGHSNNTDNKEKKKKGKKKRKNRDIYKLY